MFDYKLFGKGIRRFREEKGLTQEQLSELVDVGTQHINKIENGNVHPSLELMINICNTLEVGINDCLSENFEEGQVLYKRVKAKLGSFTDAEKVLILKSIEALASV